MLAVLGRGEDGPAIQSMLSQSDGSRVIHGQLSPGTWQQDRLCSWCTVSGALPSMGSTIPWQLPNICPSSCSCHGMLVARGKVSNSFQPARNSCQCSAIPTVHSSLGQFLTGNFHQEFCHKDTGFQKVLTFLRDAVSGV